MKWGRNTQVAAAGTVATFFVAVPATAQAASEEIVTKLDDTNDAVCSPTDCSLREAVAEANANPDGTTIRFASGLSGTISLTLPAGQLSFDSPGGIDGPGADKLTIDQTVTSARVINFTGAGFGFVDGVTITGGDQFPDGAGGGVRAVQTALAIAHSVITGNVASDGGGGVYVKDGSLGLAGSTLTDNDSYDPGGGILLQASDAEIHSSTVYDNSANGSFAHGGGIRASSGSGVTITDSTVYDNFAYGSGGGISISGSDASLRNSVVAGNYSYDGDLASDNAVDDVFTIGFSLVESTTGGTVVSEAGLIIGVDPQLSPLALNGGTTPTLMPEPGSALIDQGSTERDADQRDLARPVDFPGISAPAANGADSADIGAVEVQLPPPAGPGGPAPAPAAPRKKCKKPKKKTPAAKKKFKTCKKKLRKQAR